MIKAVIIDDEPHCVKALQNDLKMFCPEVIVLHSCYSAKEGILSIKRNQPNLIFLDVEMPWMNGFEMLEILDKEIDFQIIFTTAYDQFAVKAFRVSAVDYLLKPIDSNDLINAISKVKKGIGDKIDNANVKNMLNNARLSGESQKIAVPTRDGYDFLHVSEIIYCKASGAYTEIILKNNKKLLLSRSLGETEDILPGEIFERIHHSLLANIGHINQFKKNSSTTILMDNGDELNVSKSKKDQLLFKLGVK